MYREEQRRSRKNAKRKLFKVKKEDNGKLKPHDIVPGVVCRSVWFAE